MSKNLLLVYSFIFFTAQAQAFSISGFVEDGTNHLPVAGAYVFINNTQKFCVTDSAGNFKLDDVEFDYFDLIVAAKGFQNFSYRFTKDFINKKFRFQLQNSLPDSSFDTQSNSSVKRNYERWEKLFFSKLLSDTVNNKNYNYILNPGVLRFSYDSSSNTLKVKATDKIYFLNELLGYMMNIFIDEITITPDNGYFSGYVYYTSLKYKNEEAIEQCNLRRKFIYDASMLRFLRILYQNNSSQEDYAMNRIIRAFEGSDEYKRYEKKLNTTIFKDSLISPKKFIYMIDKHPVSAIDLLEKDTNGTVFINTNQIPILLVLNKRNIVLQNSTLIFTPGKKIRLEPNGMYFEQNDMVVEGYWHSIKLESLLPFDYMEE